MAIWIIEDNCTGCGLCLKACPYGAITMEDKLARLNDRCTECGACLSACKFEALMGDIEEDPIPDLSGYKGVLVFAQVEGENLNRVSLELLGEGRKLARATGQSLSAVVMGNRVKGVVQTLADHGAERVYVADHPDLAHYQTLAYTRVLADLITSENPAILLMGATPLGRDLAPRLSRRLDLGLTADCTELAIDPENNNLLQTRPAFGGNVMATIFTPRARPQMATVRPGVMAPSPREPGLKAQVIELEVELEPDDLLPKLVSFKALETKQVDLGAAKVIVAGGRGLKDQKGFELLEELAGALGGQVAGTRVAVEQGWIGPERQVGQTGQSVKPELYLALGISGAIQHRAGFMGARYIAAVNTDPRAPIFKVADYAILGDLFKVAPAIMEGLAKGARS